MVLCIAGHPSCADEDQERSIRRNLGIDIHRGAIAECERLRLLIGAILVDGRVKPLVALFVDGGQVDGAIGGDARLPD